MIHVWNHIISEAVQLLADVVANLSLVSCICKYLCRHYRMFDNVVASTRVSITPLQLLPGQEFER